MTREQSLADRIAAFQRQLVQQAPPEVVGGLTKEIEAMLRVQPGRGALTAGAQAPDFTLPDARGGEVKLSALLRRGPAALVFYRGDWCPYCDLQLRTYQEVLPRVQALGASLIAISPQTPDHSLTTAEKRALAFPVLSDAGNKVARSYGLVFTVSDGMLALLRGFGIDLAEYNGDGSHELPVPGTFVIGGNGRVELAFVEPDYRRRLEPDALVGELERLRKR